ncbi:MAG: PAS domain S-box protein [Bacteroidales bacterium]
MGTKTKDSQESNDSSDLSLQYDSTETNEIHFAHNLTESNEFVWVIDKSACLLFADHKFHEIFIRAGIPMAIGRSVLPETATVLFNTIWKDAFNRCLKGENLLISATLLENHDELICENSLRSLRDSAGEITGIIIRSRPLFGIRATRKNDFIQTNAKKGSLPLSKEIIEQTVLNSLTAHVAIIDSDGMIVEVNEPWRKYGIANGISNPVGTIEKVNYLEVLQSAVNQGDTYADVILKGIEDVLKHKKEEFSARYTCHSDNSLHWFAMAVTPLTGKEGGAVITHEEITDNILVEDDLKESKRKYALLSENTTDVIWLLDMDSLKLLYVSPSVERLRGFTVDEVMEQSWDMWFTAHSRHFIMNKLSEHQLDFMQGARENYVYEIEQPCKDGSAIWTEFMFYFGIDQENGHLLLYGSTYDISDRKKTEDRILKLNERITLANKAAKIGVWDMDIIANTLDWDANMFEIYGVTDIKEPDGYTSWLNAVHPDDKERCDFESEKARRGEKEYNTEYRIILPDQSVRYIRSLADVFFNADGKAIRMVGINYDITHQKNIEFKLLEDQNQFRVLNELLSDYVFKLEVDEKREYTFSIVAGNYEKTTGRNENGPNALDEWIKSVHPEDQPIVEKRFLELFSSRKSLQLEFRSYDANGNMRWIELNAKAEVNAESAKSDTVYGSIKNINERKLAQETLRKSEEKWSSIIKTSPDGISICTLQGDLLYVSDNIVKWHGYDRPEDMIGMNVLAFSKPEDLERAKHNFAAMLDGIYTGAAEYEVIRKDGSCFDIEINGEFLLDEEGRPESIFLIERDISKRKSSERALLESEYKFRKLFETMAQGVIYRDDKGRIISANRSAEKILGLSLEQMIGLSPFDPQWKVIREDGTNFPAETQPSMISLKTGQESHSIMGVFNHQLEKFVWINVSSTPEIKDGESKPYQVFTTFEDITALKESLTELDRMNQQLEGIVVERTKEILKISRFQQAILEYAGLAILSTSTQGVIQSFNTAAEEMLGYSAEEVIGWVSPLLFHDRVELELKAAELTIQLGQQVQPNFEIFSSSLSKASTITQEWNYVRKNGSRFPVKLTTSILLDDQGNTIGYIGIAEDISKEKTAFDALKASEERFYKMFYDHAAVMMLINPENGMIVDANKAAANFYGYEFSDLKKTHINEINVMSRENLKAEMDMATINQQNYFVFTHRLSSGEIRIVEVHSTPIEMETGRLLFSIIHDITDRKSAEDRLLKSEAENRAILSTMPDLLFRLDKDGKFLYYYTGNPSLLIVAPEIFIGRTMSEVLPPDVAILAMNALEQTFLTKEIVTFEYEIMMHNELHYFEDRIVSISDHEVLSIIRDVTAQKTAEKALRWNESLLKKMTSSSPLAFLVVDNRTDDILYFNHQFCEIWGINHLEERMHNKELKNNDIIPDCLPVLKDVPAFAESCKPLQSESNRVIVEDEIPFMDGRTIRRFSAQIRDENDEYHGRLYIFEDITQRKTTEEFLHIQKDLAIQLSATSDMNEALMLVLDSALKFEGIDGGGMYLIDDQNNIKLNQHKGLSEEFVSQIKKHKPSDEQIQQLVKGQPIYGKFVDLAVESAVGNPDSFIGLAAIPILFEDQLIRVFNLASKTSEDFNQNIKNILENLSLQVSGAISRIHAQEAFLNSQQNFKMVFDTIDDFMFIFDIKGNIIHANPVVNNRLGYTEKELQQLHLLAVHPPERREEVGYIIGEMLAGRASYCPVSLIAKDGTQIPVETRVIQGKWDGKDALYGISRDISQRQKAEKELQIRESYLTAVVNNHPGYFWIKDINGKFLQMNERNRQFLQQSGVRVEINGIGNSDYDFMNPKKAALYQEEDQQIISSRASLLVEEMHIINQEQFWFEKLKFPVINRYNEVIGVSGYSIDITERKKTEAALKMQSAAFESFALAIIITDLEGYIRWANSSFSKLSGYSMDEIIGKKTKDLIQSGKQEAKVYQNLWKTILEGKVWSGELTNRRKDGSLYPEEMTITPILDQNGTITSYIAIKIDITNRKEMEMALRESEARWNFALEGSGDGVWDWNAQTNEVFFSYQWKAMFGYADHEISNKLEEWETRMHPDDKTRCFEDLDRHFNGETPVYINEHRMLCKDGTYKWILDRGKVVSRSYDGKPLRVIGTHSDISQRKKLEESLHAAIEKEKELNELKSRFVSMASHEFRTPLASIMMSGETLISYWKKMDEIQINTRLVNIKGQVEHLSSVVADVMQVAKIQEGKLPFNPVPVDLSTLCETSISSFENPDTKIEFNNQCGKLYMSLDTRLIQQVLNNLLSNAIKYSGYEPQIKVQLYLEADQVMLSIQDNGIGIPKADQSRLFEPFFRASNSKQIQGNGLGLNIVREAIRMHGGEIYFNSKENKGSTFIIHFPEKCIIAT